MAWRARITTVSATVDALDDAGSPIVIDLSLNGRFSVKAEFFDSAAPGTILHTQSFDLPVTVTRAEVATKVKAAGATVRDARARVAELQADVGVVVNIP